MAEPLLLLAVDVLLLVSPPESVDPDELAADPSSLVSDDDDDESEGDDAGETVTSQFGFVMGQHMMPPPGSIVQTSEAVLQPMSWFGQQVHEPSIYIF